MGADGDTVFLFPGQGSQARARSSVALGAPGEDTAVIASNSGAKTGTPMA